MADRFAYLPSVAFAALAAIAVRALAARWASARPGRPAAERAAVAVMAAVALALAARTYARNRDWKNEETLFAAASRTSPRSFKVHKGIANALLADKTTSGERLDRAIAAAERGMTIIDEGRLPPVDQPSDLMALLGLAYILKGDSLGGGKMGQTPPPAAAEWYGKAVVLLERAVETDRAVNERVKADKIRAGMPAEEIRDVGLRRVHGTLGNAYMRLGQPDKALPVFAHLRVLDPMRTDGYTQSAWALVESGRLDEGAVLLLEAQLIDPRSNVGSLLADVYRRMDPPITLAGGSLDRTEPRVQRHVLDACAAAVRVFRTAGRLPEAADVRRDCLTQYGASPEALDRALAAP